MRPAEFNPESIIEAGQELQAAGRTGLGLKTIGALLSAITAIAPKDARTPWFGLNVWLR